MSLFSNTVRSINMKSGGEDLWADPFLYVSCVCGVLQRNAGVVGLGPIFSSAAWSPLNLFFNTDFWAFS